MFYYQTHQHPKNVLKFHMIKIQLSNYFRLTITMISKQKLIINVSHLITNEIFTNTK